MFIGFKTYKNLNVNIPIFIEQFGYAIVDYKLDKSISKNIKNGRIMAINKHCTNLIANNTVSETGFLYPFRVPSKVRKELCDYLIDNKKFVYEWLCQADEFIVTPLSQLYIEYIPNELTKVEKAIFLDSYISMIAKEFDSKKIARKERKIQEKRLRLLDE